MAQRGLIYGRASHDPKHRGTSVTDQLRECQAWADANDIDVVRTIRDDNRPASKYATREREGFAEVLQLVQGGSIDILIVWEPSRAARDLEVFVTLRAACQVAGVELSYKGRRYDLTQTNDSFAATLDALMAEREGSEIRDRNVRTVRRNAEARRPHGRLPYGYKRVYDASNGGLIGQTPFVLANEAGEPKPTRGGELVPVLPDDSRPKTLCPEAQVVADAAREVLAGKTLRRVARDLTERGVPSPRKPNRRTLAENPAGVVSTWTPESLRQRLVNPTIAGRRVHQGKDIGEASWAPIIEYSTWLTLHALLTDPSRRSLTVPRGPAPRHLLSNIALCGECGARMKARTNMSRMPRAYACHAEGCRRITVTAGKVDELVEAVLRVLFDSSGFREDLARAYREQAAQPVAGSDVPARIAALEAERDELEQMRAQDLITLRAYAMEDKRLEEQIEQLQEEQVAPVTSAAVRQMLEAGSFSSGWEAQDLYGKRDIVRVLLTVSVDRATSVGRVFDYGRVRIGPSAFLNESWTNLVEQDPAEVFPLTAEDFDFEPVHPSAEQPPPPPEQPKTADDWAALIADAFPRPGPEVARRLASLAPLDEIGSGPVARGADDHAADG